jgi:hypothetical protein
MSFYYAQINEQNICLAVSELAAEMSESNLISIDTFDTSLLGKMWNGSSWEESPQPESEEQTT